MNELMLYLDENGVAHKYDDTYDVTVHCENKEAQDKIIKILNKSCKRRVNYTFDGSYIGNIMAPEAAQCPSCNFEFDESAEEWECCYCPKCGQRLSWEIEDVADEGE